MITRLKCTGSKKYKAVRKPTCGCLLCWAKYKFNRQSPAPRAVKRTRTKVSPSVTKVDTVHHEEVEVAN